MTCPCTKTHPHLGKGTARAAFSFFTSKLMTVLSNRYADDRWSKTDSAEIKVYLDFMMKLNEVAGNLHHCEMDTNTKANAA